MKVWSKVSLANQPHCWAQILMFVKSVVERDNRCPTHSTVPWAQYCSIQLYGAQYQKEIKRHLCARAHELLNTLRIWANLVSASITYSCGSIQNYSPSSSANPSYVKTVWGIRGAEFCGFLAWAHCVHAPRTLLLLYSAGYLYSPSILIILIHEVLGFTGGRLMLGHKEVVMRHQ
jgi:hypothetical protein